MSGLVIMQYVRWSRTEHVDYYLKYTNVFCVCKKHSKDLK